MSGQQGTFAEKMQRDAIQQSTSLALYPVDMSSFLALSWCEFDAAGIPFHALEYHPTTIAQFALAHWNRYLATNDESHRRIFLLQAYWLVEHETRMRNGSGAWPISSSHADVHGKGPWLSALTQGNALSVLVRAYQLTRQAIFLEVASRAVRSFQLDILDGGVSSPIGEDGIFFEEIAVYPALHTLHGCIVALLGLYEYVSCTDDAEVRKFIGRSLLTFHLVLDEFDTGFWVRTDLLHRKLASPDKLALLTALLAALSNYAGCEHCSLLVSRWQDYQCKARSRLRYVVSSRFSSLTGKLLSQLRSKLFPRTQASPVLRVCVPITAFPVTGGMRTILAKIAQVTADIWQMEYFTQSIGPDAEGFTIHQFGGTRSTPWQFPHVWLYVLAGFRTLISLVHKGSNYDVILPQDGIFTAAFAGLAGKLADVRVVCIDHGNLIALANPLYRSELLRALATQAGIRGAIKRLLFVGYWPSLSAMVWLAAHCVDHFCVPGVAGDGVEDMCRRFGIGPDRLTRFVNTVDRDHQVDASTKSAMRAQKSIPADAIVITMICRLAPEKGIPIALESIVYALAVLSPKLRERVHFIIAGDGPLRQQIEEDICRKQLGQQCVLWGEISPTDVMALHSLSDIHLYTGTRAGGYPLVILEAMTWGCAVLASNVPLANEHMLADGRGMVVPAGDAEQAGAALVQLIENSELRCRMGQLAREYVASHNTPTLFKRVLLRMTCWSSLDKLLAAEREGEK